MKQINKDIETKTEQFRSKENEETVDLNSESFKLYNIPIVWWCMLWVPQNGTYKEKFIFRMINDFECESKCECIRYSITTSTEFEYCKKSGAKRNMRYTMSHWDWKNFISISSIWWG